MHVRPFALAALVCAFFPKLISPLCAQVWAIDLETWSWSKIDRIKGNPPRPRADHTVCVAGNLLILSGGRRAQSRPHALHAPSTS
eukprot:5191953-Pleurochrysis_carterae.AAC.3